MDDLDLDLQGCKLLVVDDVPANLDVLIHALEDQCYDILVATSGEAASPSLACSCSRRTS